VLSVREIQVHDHRSSPSPGDCVNPLGQAKAQPVLERQRPFFRLQHLSWLDPNVHRIQPKGIHRECEWKRSETTVEQPEQDGYHARARWPHHHEECCPRAADSSGLAGGEAGRSRRVPQAAATAARRYAEPWGARSAPRPSASRRGWSWGARLRRLDRCPIRARAAPENSGHPPRGPPSWPLTSRAFSWKGCFANTPRFRK
jgi:hypothetical protein